MVDMGAAGLGGFSKKLVWLGMVGMLELLMLARRLMAERNRSCMSMNGQMGNRDRICSYGLL